METKKCAQCGQEKPIEDFSKSYKNLCKACVAENERLKRKVNKAFGCPEDMPNTPFMIFEASDNPQFIPNPRFIASVAAMQGLLAGGYKAAYKDLALTAVACADALINELKKKKDEVEEHNGTPV